MTLELWPLIEVKIAFCSFPLSNLSSFYRFSSNFAYYLIPARIGLGLKIGKFRETSNFINRQS